jgi:uncharacterized membrane protein
MADPGSATEGLYRGVQRTLIGGMALSFSLMGVGLAWQLANPQPHPEQVVPLDRLPAELLAGNPLALLDSGLLVLLLIPAVHLSVAAVQFGRQREPRYLALTLLVLGLLALGAVLAFLIPRS